MEHVNIIENLAVRFFVAWLLGLIAYRFKLSPIVGYLFAGLIVGPYTVGYVADSDLAQQLAEIGVIFLMFGVGLHFNVKDLYSVRWIAIPCALCQSAFATICGSTIFYYLGLPVRSAIVLALSICVASTVVLVRVLQDNNKLATRSGHIAIGWLIVEDILAVIALILLPLVALDGGSSGTELTPVGIGQALLETFLKLAGLIAIMFFAGAKAIPYLMLHVAKLRSRELFTLTILVFSITIAAGAAKLFGVSLALGAFLAGMLVAQSPTSHQVASNSLPLQDTFAIIFFVSVGMLLDIQGLKENPYLFISMLALILVIKPIVVMTLVTLGKQPFRTALTIALGFTQIGEFSFIMAALAFKLGLISNDAYSSVVATAIVCIILNPIIFKLEEPIEKKLKSNEKLWRFLNRKAFSRLKNINELSVEGIKNSTFNEDNQLAIVVGFGVVGQGVCKILKKSGIKTVVIDTNMGTIARINETKTGCDFAIFGDASNANILLEAGIKDAKYLLITMAMDSNPAPVIELARQLNPNIQTFVRGRFVGERNQLNLSGASQLVFDEAETAIAMGLMIVDKLGKHSEDYNDEMQEIRVSVGL